MCAVRYPPYIDFLVYDSWFGLLNTVETTDFVNLELIAWFIISVSLTAIVRSRLEAGNNILRVHNVALVGSSLRSYKVFMLTIILSNYQLCPVPLNFEAMELQKSCRTQPSEWYGSIRVVGTRPISLDEADPAGDQLIKKKKKNLFVDSHRMNQIELWLRAWLE